MLTAAMVAAGVTACAVLMVMVVTVNIGIVTQVIAEQGVYSCICITLNAAVELDARFGECCLRTSTDASANQSVHTVLH